MTQETELMMDHSVRTLSLCLVFSIFLFDFFIMIFGMLHI